MLKDVLMKILSFAASTAALSSSLCYVSGNCTPLIMEICIQRSIPTNMTLPQLLEKNFRKYNWCYKNVWEPSQNFLFCGHRQNRRIYTRWEVDCVIVSVPDIPSTLTGCNLVLWWRCIQFEDQECKLKPSMFRTDRNSLFIWAARYYVIHI